MSDLGTFWVAPPDGWEYGDTPPDGVPLATATNMNSREALIRALIADGEVTQLVALGQELVVANDVAPPLPYAATTLVKVTYMFRLAPTGSNFIFEVVQGSTTLATVTCPATQSYGTFTLPDPRAINAFEDDGEDIRINITQVGSTLHGDRLTIGLVTNAGVEAVTDAPSYVQFGTPSETALNSTNWYDPTPTAYQYGFTFPVATSVDIAAPPSGSPGNYLQAIAKDVVLPASTQDAELTCRIDLTGKVPDNGSWWFGPILRATFLAPPDEIYATFERLSISWDGSNWVAYLGTDAGRYSVNNVAVIAGANKVLRVRFRVQGATSYGKVWVDGSAEPGSWGDTQAVSVRDGGVGFGAEYEPNSGSLVLDELEVTAL